MKEGRGHCYEYIYRGDFSEVLLTLGAGTGFDDCAEDVRTFVIVYALATLKLVAAAVLSLLGVQRGKWTSESDGYSRHCGHCVIWG